MNKMKLNQLIAEKELLYKEIKKHPEEILRDKTNKHKLRYAIEHALRIGDYSIVEMILPYIDDKNEVFEIACAFRAERIASKLLDEIDPCKVSFEIFNYAEFSLSFIKRFLNKKAPTNLKKHIKEAIKYGLAEPAILLLKYAKEESSTHLWEPKQFWKLHNIEHIDHFSTICRLLIECKIYDQETVDVALQSTVVGRDNELIDFLVQSGGDPTNIPDYSLYVKRCKITFLLPLCKGKQADSSIKQAFTNSLSELQLVPLIFSFIENHTVAKNILIATFDPGFKPF